MDEEATVPPDDVLSFGETTRGFAPGQEVFTRYVLQRILGRGGMGIVWLAHDKILERDVALKLLLQLLVHDRAAMGELKAEAVKGMKLTHPNIVRIYDFVQDDSSCGIPMEYVDGDTLSNLRMDKPNKVFETRDLDNWVRQLCDALAYAHEKVKIVHQDLKPLNLMIDAAGDLKVTDFGISRSISDSVSRVTSAKPGGGTLVYMSPQQMDGERPSISDDIYSLGATLYQLIASKPPFYSGDVWRLVHEKAPPSMAQRRAELEIQGEPIPQEWERAVAACLSKDPAQRPESVREIPELLGLRKESVKLSRSMVGMMAPPAAKPAGPKLQISRKAILAASAAVVALALAGLGYHFRQPIRESAGHTRLRIGAWWNDGGKLIVQTVPKGAQVSVFKPGSNELVTQATTPVKLPVGPGKYDVKIEMAGYESEPRAGVEVRQESGTDLGNIKLAQTTGSLTVTGKPDGIEVLVDGKSLGVTPLAKPLPLPTGTHTVAGRYKGWPDQTQNVVVEKGKAASVPLEFYGMLAVTTDPPGATISMDGKDWGVTPQTIKAAPGRPSLRLSKKGYHEVAVGPLIDSSATVTVAKKMDALVEAPRVGGVVLKTEPEGAEVHVDGAARTLGDLKSLTVGNHSLSISFSGYETKEIPVEIAEGKIRDLGLVKLERSVGELTVKSAPAGAHYTIVWAGDPNDPARIKIEPGVTPGKPLRLPTGLYEIRVKRGDWELPAGRVEITRDHPTPAEFTFDYASLVVNSDPAGAMVSLRGEFLSGDLKKPTPARFTELRPGKYSVTISREGYGDDSCEVVLTPGGAKDLKTVALIRDTGALEITSDPVGAQILIDGEAKGLTPLPKLDGMATGVYEVMARYQDGTVLKQKLEVKKGQATPYRFEILYGSVELIGGPPGAAVFEGDRRVGMLPLDRSPLVLEKVKPGKVSYQIKLDGYKDGAAAGEVKSKDKKTLIVKMEKMERTEPVKPPSRTEKTEEDKLKPDSHPNRSGDDWINFPAIGGDLDKLPGGKPAPKGRKGGE